MGMATLTNAGSQLEQSPLAASPRRSSSSAVHGLIHACGLLFGVELDSLIPCPCRRGRYLPRLMASPSLLDKKPHFLQYGFFEYERCISAQNNFSSSISLVTSCLPNAKVTNRSNSSRRSICLACERMCAALWHPAIFEQLDQRCYY